MEQQMASLFVCFLHNILALKNLKEPENHVSSLHVPRYFSKRSEKCYISDNNLYNAKYFNNNSTL